MQWDIFCRVIDNHGDLGVCWRLAADLGARGHATRLWVDDAAALRWMAPSGATGVTVQHWDDSIEPAVQPADVVIEAFGCTLPESFVARMAAAPSPPRWINLEYLSAESYVERSHRLRSPQWHGAAQGLVKWFFYPGFSPATGGLLREPTIAAQQATFEPAPWLAAQGITRRAGERLASVFCYPDAPLSTLIDRLADAPTLLVLAAGRDAPFPLPTRVRCVSLPYLDQTGYDRLLWSCDLNLVRGEDSFVRAQWAGRPFVWHIYAQDDGAHAAKLEAFLARYPTVPGLRELWQAWNGLAPWPAVVPPFATSASRWDDAAQEWRAELWRQPDLVTQLIEFAAEEV